MAFRHALPVVFASLLLANTAWADDDEKPKASNGDWEVGARLHYVTANPIIGIFYEKSESVTGQTFGVLLNKRSNDGSTRMVVGLDYTSTAPDDGLWLADGDEPTDQEWTEFRGLSMISANLMFGHVLRRGPMGFFFGGGVGLDAVQGKITSFDTINGQKIDGTGDKKNIPGITPTILFKMGPQMEVGKLATVNLDLGFHHGLFVGVSASTNLPF